jgi:hypothetical protein
MVMTSRTNAPHNGTATSRDAARRITPSLQRLQLRVLQAVVSVGSATRQELESLARLPGDTIRPRVDELLKLKLLKEPEGVFRLTKRGRKAQVLWPTLKGCNRVIND